MAPSVFVLVVSVTFVVALGVVLTATAPSWRVPRLLQAGRDRALAAVDAGVPHVGRVVVAVTVALAGFGLTLIVGWFLGKLAHQLEPSVDVPLFHWFQDRQLPGPWTHAWNALTKLGNRRQTQEIAVVGAVLLAVLWRRRGWWIPFFVLPAGYMFEKFGQMLLAATVHRGHPPTTLGTYPSGGTARLMVVYGLAIFLLLRWKHVSRRGWVAGWSLLTFLVTLEGYSRTYLLKHWFTDVVGGVIYGALILGAVIAGVCILDRKVRRPRTEALDGLQRPEPAAARPPDPLDVSVVEGSR